MKPYKVLVVDDAEVIHMMTDLVLEGIEFSDFKIEIFKAYSAKEAKAILQEHDDIALALIDVNMETSTAGLDLVEYIRNELKYQLIRLVIRTSEVSKYPAIDVVLKYDINDFIDKSEVTKERLFTCVRTSIKQYKQLLDLEEKYQDMYTRLFVIKRREIFRL